MIIAIHNLAYRIDLGVTYDISIMTQIPQINLKCVKIGLPQNDAASRDVCDGLK